jgi:hypothetical protein
MSDDLDDLLRAAMKTLDDQVPSGYFEALPKRTLMRLEDSSMQTTGTSDNSKPTGAPPPEDRDEDSGLHDIRSMASSAKVRISSKRITTNPPVDDDILASSSAGWKAVALPEPARMVSLPEIDAPVEEAAPSSERKSKKELKAERTSASKIAKEAIAVETSASISGSMSPAPAAKPDIAAPIIGARFQQKQKSKSGKGGLYAMLGVGLAAAAGVGWYVSTQMKSSDNEQVASVSQDRAERSVQAQSAPAAAPAAGSATVTAIAEPTPPAEPKADEAVATGMGGAASTTGADDAKIASDEGAKRGNVKSAAKPDKPDKQDKKKEAEKPADKKTELPKDATKGDGKKNEGGEGEPSFDALLKEAGVQDKKPVKVALEKKSLSGADFKKGMGAVAGKAQACYAGTQGTAQLKLTVSPEGTVQKVAVTGVFAGTPVAKCVETAVKGATFPAWDGGPQSFGYSYLLAE